MEKKSDGKVVVAHLLSGKRVTGDALLYAMGRLGNTDSLNLQVIFFSTTFGSHNRRGPRSGLFVHRVPYAQPATAVS